MTCRGCGCEVEVCQSLGLIEVMRVSEESWRIGETRLTKGTSERRIELLFEWLRMHRSKFRSGSLGCQGMSHPFLRPAWVEVIC